MRVRNTRYDWHRDAVSRENHPPLNQEPGKVLSQMGKPEADFKKAQVAHLDAKQGLERAKLKLDQSRKAAAQRAATRKA